MSVQAVSAAGIVGFGVLYVLLFLLLGLRSIKRGHWITFLIGIPIPLFSVIGGRMPPVERRCAEPGSDPRRGVAGGGLSERGSGAGVRCEAEVGERRSRCQ